MNRMRRRVLVGATGVLGALAGCSGRSASLAVEEVWFPEGGGENGRFLVRAEVANPGVEVVSGTVYLYATVDERTYVRSTSVTVEPGAHVVAEASFPVAYETAASSGVGARADVVVED